MRVLLERELGFNVFTYGAVGDGLIDDHAAIQRAIDAACEASSVNGYGGVVRFPPFLYKSTRRWHVWADNVRIEGSVTRGTRFQYVPDPLYNEPGLFLFEAADPGPLLHCGISNMEIRAAQDTALVKYAVDLHGTREFEMHNVRVQSWSDTTKSSSALRVRGWDSLLFRMLSLTADIPVRISSNADLDDNKDIDHATFFRCTFGADNTSKIAFLVEDGVVFRNLTLDGIAFVQGGFYCVDTTAPRRMSTNLAIRNARFEGFSETSGTAVGTYAIDIRRHANGKLRGIDVHNALLGEGAEARYDGFSGGVAWNGARVNGVWRSTLTEVTYAGEGTPVTYDGRAPTITGGQLTAQDNGKAKPAVEAQWDQLGIARPRSWWKFSGASGNPSDQQDATVSGLPDRSLVANGGPLYQQLVNGSKDYHNGFTEATDQRFGLNSGLTDFNPNDRSAAWYASYKFSSGWTPGGDRVLINLGAAGLAGALGPVVYIATDGTLKTYAGNTVVSGSRDYRNKSIGLLPVYNRTAGTWTIYVGMDGSLTIETITGTYGAAVGSVNQKGFGAESASFTSALAFIDFGAMWFNADAEGLSAATLRAMGWGV